MTGWARGDDVQMVFTGTIYVARDGRIRCDPDFQGIAYVQWMTNDPFPQETT